MNFHRARFIFLTESSFLSKIVTGSYDATIKVWDLATGKCMTTLTHHKKAVRALTQPSFQNTFLSGAADNLKSGWVPTVDSTKISPDTGP